ncbi:hypothetical protein tloyanaT_07690 [Thalassotalea loyana]|uniref:Uncharacterized protein n=1 Tax=Thalassotalea loyana TaxID=280483 RepID=A0ABQ6HA85_9GAMM|nr:hypothetical protein tloyanaT_07690 [Thalassotalea loyana]
MPTIYYANSKPIAQSAHGLLAFIGFSYAIIACEYTKFDPEAYWYYPIYAFFVLSLLSVIYSLKAFKVKRIVHLIHIVTIGANLLAVFISLMALAHDWI